MAVIYLLDIVDSLVDPVRFLMEQAGLYKWIRLAPFLAILIYLSAIGLGRLTYWYIKRLLKKKLAIKTAIDLHPKYSDAVVEEYTTNYVQPQFQLNSPSIDIYQKDRLVYNSEKQNIFLGAETVIGLEDSFALINFFLRRVFKRHRKRTLARWLWKIPFMNNLRSKKSIVAEGQYFIVLGDTGMGKTAFLINLFLAYARKMYRDFEIEIFSLTHPDLEKAIVSIPNPRNTILLLDALDEDVKATKDTNNRLNAIMAMGSGFRALVLTCRTQFFAHENKLPRKIPYQTEKDRADSGWKHLYLTPFTDRQIDEFIRKKYSRRHLRVKAKRIVLQIPDIVIRPLILKYLDVFINGNRSFYFKIDVYETIIDNWFERETFNMSLEEQYDFKINMLNFSLQIAKYIYDHPLNGQLKIAASQISSVAAANDINLQELVLQTKSLLHRGEEDKYKFSHKSILEYLLSHHLYHDEKFLMSFTFGNFDAALEFLVERCTKYDTIPYIRDLVPEYNLDQISDDDFPIIVNLLHEKTDVPITKLHVLIWRPDDTHQFRFDWTLLDEIDSISIKCGTAFDIWKVATGLRYVNKISVSNSNPETYQVQLRILQLIKSDHHSFNINYV